MGFPNNVLRTRIRGSILVLIPALNEAQALPGVLRHMPDSVDGVPVVALVVDDGSDDGTADVAEAEGALAIRHPVNRGGGAALQSGFAAALDGEARAVVTMDADGQHLPQELPALVRPVLSGDVDLTLGSRALGSADPNSRARELGITVFNRLISALMRRRITDCSNSYRAIRTELIPQLVLRQQQFHTSEFLIQALARGARVTEVPVTVALRTHGETRKPRTFRYGYGFARAILMTWTRTLPLRLRRRVMRMRGRDTRLVR
jgi:glycosyltransferase involved in cell wall biosynthesis